jgi:hypothetical protein
LARSLHELLIDSGSSHGVVEAFDVVCVRDWRLARGLRLHNRDRFERRRLVRGELCAGFDEQPQPLLEVVERAGDLERASRARPA